jgi:DNA-binding transcriptional LysR family regulator
MELLELQYFVAVADAGNFTRAAMFLGINASTISRRISRLEDELGLTALSTLLDHLNTTRSYLSSHTSSKRQPL